MPACLPEQFIRIGSAAAARPQPGVAGGLRDGSAAGQRSAPGSRPGRRRGSSRTRRMWNGSPKWLPLIRARSAASRGTRPARSMPTVCSGLFDERGSIGPVTSPRARTAAPSDRHRTVVHALHETGAHHLRDDHRTGGIAEQLRGPRRRSAAAAGRAGRNRPRGRPAACSTRPAGPSRTSRCPPCRPAGDRRWPATPASPGCVLRPMPVAENVVPAGRSRIACSHATRAAAVPGIPPGTPITRSTCTWPPAGSPYGRAAAAAW